MVLGWVHSRTGEVRCHAGSTRGGRTAVEEIPLQEELKLIGPYIIVEADGRRSARSGRESPADQWDDPFLPLVRGRFRRQERRPPRREDTSTSRLGGRGPTRHEHDAQPRQRSSTSTTPTARAELRPRREGVCPELRPRRKWSSVAFSQTSNTRSSSIHPPPRSSVTSTKRSFGAGISRGPMGRPLPPETTPRTLSPQTRGHQHLLHKWIPAARARRPTRPSPRTSAAAGGDLRGWPSITSLNRET